MRLILVGFGTVGRGVAECLSTAASDLARLGITPTIVGVIDPVVGSVRCDAGLDPQQLVAIADAGGALTDADGAAPVDDIDELLAAGTPDVLVELTPTNLQTGEPGLTHVRAAIAAGLHVSTTNKGPIALAHRELADAAAAAGVEVRFEGTVMSGTPVLNVCEVGLAGAEIDGIRGVLNGTCNYILSSMESGSTFDDALADATAKGYAETDPSGDVDGWDAAAKALILANCVLGGELTMGDVARRGIRDVTAEDMQAALAEGETWRLVARVDPDNGAWRASVGPERVRRDDPLGALTGPGNLLVFSTKSLGDVVVSGPGAGRGATGHAVIADLIAIAAATR